MTGPVLANHSSGHWLLDFLVFMTPAIALAVVLWVWKRRDKASHGHREEAHKPDAD